MHKAYDLLAPVVGLEISSELDGTKIADLVFPYDVDAPVDDVVLQLLPGIKLDKDSQKSDVPESSPSEPTRRQKIHRWLLSQRMFLTNRQYALPDFLRGPNGQRATHNVVAQIVQSEETTDTSSNDPSSIMSYLPAIQHGSIPMVTERLQTYLNNNNSNGD